MSQTQDLVRAVLRLSIVAVCTVGIWCTWTLGRAEYLFRQDTPESIRAALKLEPDAWPYYLRLAQFDRTDSVALLAESIAFDRYDAQAYIELAFEEESEGKVAQADHLLHTAF